MANINSPGLPTSPRSRATLKPCIPLWQIYHLMHRYKLNENIYHVYTQLIYCLRELQKQTMHLFSMTRQASVLVFNGIFFALRPKHIKNKH